MARSMKRTKRRRMRRNPLTPKQKLLAVGGLAVVGGVAAYALTRPTSPPTGGGGGGATTPGGPTSATCAALQAELNQLMSAPTPDAAAIRRKQEAVFACVAAVRTAGGTVDDTTSNLADGDNAYRHIEDQFADYKRTSKDDPLKRNNVRQDILNVGTTMAASYSAAANAATDAAGARAVRQSILRALDAAVQRQLCYLYQLDPQCGRNGVNEDADVDKAGQEYARIVSPLHDAHGLAVQKLWSKGGGTQPDNAAYFTTLLRPALAAIDYATLKFNEYKSVDSGGDPVRKNNLRQVVLAAGRAATAALQFAFDQASGYRDSAGMRAVGATILLALAPAIARWTCYLTGAQGCDTFGVSEDSNRAKADQEYATTIGPLSDLYMQVASKLVSWNVDLAAYEPLITLKLQRCSALNSYVNAKFNEYKSVDSGGDPVRKNNLRQVVLQNGSLLATCLQDAMGSAIAGANATPPSLLSQAALTLLTNRTLTTPFHLLPSTGTSGLGLVTLVTPMKIQGLAPLLVKIPATTPTTAPTTDAAALAVLTAGKRMVLAVLGVAKTALDASLVRQLCYLFGQPGCDTFGVSEDPNNVKADQEYNTVGKPIMEAMAQGATFLAGKGDSQGDVTLIKSKLLYCNALATQVNAKFAEFRSVAWSDWLRRNNIRDYLYGVARNMVQCFRDTAPSTAAGRTLVKAAVDAALAASTARSACYLDRSSNCGRGWDAQEPTNEDKAAIEKAQVTDPLTTISSRLASGQSLSGLGLAIDSGTWFNIGAAAVLGGLLVWGTHPKRKMKRNKRVRRTSRRTR